MCSVQTNVQLSAKKKNNYIFTFYALVCSPERRFSRVPCLYFTNLLELGSYKLLCKFYVYVRMYEEKADCQHFLLRHTPKKRKIEHAKTTITQFLCLL